MCVPFFALKAEGDAAKTNFVYKQHATRDLLRRLQQQGRLMGQAAGSAAAPASGVAAIWQLD
jgi:hypothetical protein